jgi:S-adenosylmethionine:tRNA ribosyltransferase-isomerase
MRVADFDFDLPAERIALRPARPRDSARLLVVDGSEICDRAVLDLPRLLGPGDVLVFNDTKVIPAQLASVIEKSDDGSALLHFHGEEPVELLLDRAGRMPLPPYIASRREVDEADREDYQTMFAREEGAVAAPTAALHFTERLLEALDEHGVGRETLTLHVGAGTFLPVKSEKIEDHKMHAEWGRIDAAAAERLNAGRRSGGRLIFITPGYRFKAIDGLITNFHLPRSTLFMLVSALMGLDAMKAAYAHAIEAGYRFYSYGDASLLLPEAPTSLR